MKQDELLKMTLKDVSIGYPEISRAVLSKATGSGSNSIENINRVAPFITLEKLLKQLNINRDLFFKEIESSSSANKVEDFDIEKKFPPFVALLPCGLRNPFSTVFDHFIERWSRDQDYMIEGNVNHELSYYEYVQTIDSLDKLPDLMITSDINSLFHKRFQDNFVNSQSFSDTIPAINPLYKRSGMCDPKNKYTFIATNILVIVTVNDKLEGIKKPESWKDLLSTEFSNSIGVRGENDFFCHSVSVPFYLLFGKEGLEKLSANISSCYHPSEMVKLCNNPAIDSPSVFIMPWFFAQKIKKSDNISIIFPEEGAFTSPVSLFVKKESVDKYREILDFITGEEISRLCDELWCPSAYSAHTPGFPEDKSLYWIGWDTIRKSDLADIKREIDDIFAKAVKKRRVPILGFSR